MAAIVMAPARLGAERWFYSGFALAALAVVFVGFAPTFFLRPLFPHARSPSETIFYVHGTVATAWMLLLIVQTRLIAMQRTPLHRRLGAFGGVLAGTLVVLGTWGALVAARRATGFTSVPIPALQFLTIPLFDVTLFATFVTVALLRRRDLQAHKRWMLLATINLLPAAIARWPGMAPLGPIGFFGVADLFVLAIAAWDLRSRGRLHPATLIGGALLIASQPLRLIVSGTAAWLAFAHWATGLPY